MTGERRDLSSGYLREVTILEPHGLISNAHGVDEVTLATGVGVSPTRERPAGLSRLPSAIATEKAGDWDAEVGQGRGARALVVVAGAGNR